MSTSTADPTVVHVAGELDLATTPQLVQALYWAQRSARLVVLDMRELAFVDSSGVHAVVNASTRARRVGERLVLVRGAPAVDHAFTMTGIAGSVEITDLDASEPPVEALLRLAQQNQRA